MHNVNCRQRSSVISEVSKRCKSLLLGQEDGSENQLIKHKTEWDEFQQASD